MIDANELVNKFILGDCMEYLKEIPENFFELAITDPPYGGVTQGGYMTNKASGGVARHKDYNLSLWDQKAPNKEYFAELLRVSKNQIIWGGNYFADMLPSSQGWVIWDKRHLAPRSYADAELAWTSFDRATRIFRYTWDGMIQEDMLNKEIKIHPTQKPVALYKWLLDNYASPGDKILDTHVGSGSSILACIDRAFSYTGFEIDKTYYELTQKRLEDAARQITIFDLLKT